MILLLYLAYIKFQSIKKINALWISSGGIHLPYSYDKRMNEHFINFDDIEKIILYLPYPNYYRGFRMAIFLKKKIKPWRPLSPKDRIGITLLGVNPYEFGQALKETAGDKIKIEYSWWPQNTYGNPPEWKER